MDYQLFGTEDYFGILESYVRGLNRPVLIVEKVGINNSEDQEKIDAAYELYKQILPVEIFAALKQEKIFSVLFHSNGLAEDFARDMFPAKKTDDEIYVKVLYFNNNGELLYDNQS